MSNKFQNKVAIVTGGATGIGRATALAFAEKNVRVIVADVAEDKARETMNAIEEGGGRARFVRADVADPDDVRKMVDETFDAYGRLDYAFNNAGIEGEQAPTGETSEENWDRVMGVNLKGVWLCMKYEIKRMLQQGSGSIVNISSVAGKTGFEGIPAYAAAKHGILGLTKTAALEYATEGIRINAVCPGVVQTEMIDRFTGDDDAERAKLVEKEPIDRLDTPEEIASAVLWLCSDEASFVTGHPLVVDGGGRRFSRAAGRDAGAAPARFVA